MLVVAVVLSYVFDFTSLFLCVSIELFRLPRLTSTNAMMRITHNNNMPPATPRPIGSDRLLSKSGPPSLTAETVLAAVAGDSDDGTVTVVDETNCTGVCRGVGVAVVAGVGNGVGKGVGGVGCGV